jgi:hypothetical protein
MATLTLGKSVGAGGANEPADVTALKTHLVALGLDWLTVDGTAGNDLTQAIKLQQSIFRGRNAVSGDGRVDVGGPTLEYLNSADAARWQEMPPGGGADDGFVNLELRDLADHHDFGTSWMADTLADAGRWYHDNHLGSTPGDAPITVNDVSLPRGGPTPDHAGHETGLEADLRLPRTDGTAPGGTTHTTATYDRDATRAQLRALRHQPMVSRIFFNDPVLIGEHLCTRASGHDNHLHVEIKPLPALVGYGDDYESLLDAATASFGGTVVDPRDHAMTPAGFQEYLTATGVAHFSARETLTPHDARVASELGYETFLPPHAWWKRGAALALIADELRRLVGEPVKMRNWWRPVEYNRRVDGAEGSDHVTAHGVDLDYRSADSRRRAERRLRELDAAHPDLQFSIGLGNVTTHVGVLSPGRRRQWRYDSYVE